MLTLSITAVICALLVVLVLYALHRIEPTKFQFKATATKWVSIEMNIEGAARPPDSPPDASETPPAPDETTPDLRVVDNGSS